MAKTAAVKVVKVPGAKMPKLQASIPKAPKLPQMASNLNPYTNTKPFLPKSPKGAMSGL